MNSHFTFSRSRAILAVLVVFVGVVVFPVVIARTFSHIGQHFICITLEGVVGNLKIVEILITCCPTFSRQFSEIIPLWWLHFSNWSVYRSTPVTDCPVGTARCCCCMALRGCTSATSSVHYRAYNLQSTCRSSSSRYCGGTLHLRKACQFER